MRILQVSSARALGGGERHLAALACGLAARGHEVHVAVRAGSPLPEQLRELPARNIINVSLRNALDVRGALQLARLVREREIEIVHAHMARDYPPAAFAVRRERRARLVITRHVLFPLNRLHAMTFAQASRVIAVSGAVARQLSAQKFVDQDKLSVVPNGIDLARFDATERGVHAEAFRRRLNLAPGRVLVGTAGELKRLKGHEEFLRAAAIIARELPAAEFVIAGADPLPKGEYLSSLRRLVQQLSLAGRVHFTGWLEDIFPMLCALDLFVSASHTESFGLAIVEAMASGAAVVATATEGAREIITAETGRLVPIGDASAIAHAALSLLEDSRERARLAALARESARQRFSLGQMVSATEQIYREA